MPHTPAPWHRMGDRHVVADMNRDGRAILSLDPYDFDAETRAANLALVAASPDMLAMLRLFVNRAVPAGRDSCDADMVKYRAALVDMARDVIAKAEGRP